MNYESSHTSDSDDHEVWFEVAIDHAQRQLADALSETFQSLRKRLHRSCPVSAPEQDHANPQVEPQATHHPAEPEVHEGATETVLDPRPEQQFSPYALPIEPAPQSPARPEVPAEQAPVPHLDPAFQSGAPLPEPADEPVSAKADPPAGVDAPISQPKPEAAQPSAFFPGQSPAPDLSPSPPAPVQPIHEQVPAPAPTAQQSPTDVPVQSGPFNPVTGPGIDPHQFQTPVADPFQSTLDGQQQAPEPQSAAETPAIPITAPNPPAAEFAPENHPQDLPNPEPQVTSPPQVDPVATAPDPVASPFLSPEQQASFVQHQEGLAPGIADALPPSSPILSKEEAALVPPQENAFLPGSPPAVENPPAENSQELDAALHNAFEAESRPKTSEIYRPGESASPASPPLTSPFEQVSHPPQPAAEQPFPTSLFEPPTNQQQATGEPHGTIVPQPHNVPVSPGSPFPAQPPLTSEFPPRPISPLPGPTHGNDGIFPQTAPQGPFELTSPPAEQSPDAPQTPQQFPGQPLQNRGVQPQSPNGDDVMLKGSDDA